MEAFGILIAFVIPRHIVHKHCTGFYLAFHRSALIFHLGSLAIKALGAYCLIDYSAISFLWASAPMCCEAVTASIGVTPFLFYCLIKLFFDKDSIFFGFFFFGFFPFAFFGFFPFSFLGFSLLLFWVFPFFTVLRQLTFFCLFFPLSLSQEDGIETHLRLR